MPLWLMLEGFSLGIMVLMEEIIKKFGIEKVLPPKTVFISQGDTSSNLFYLVSGSVQIYRTSLDGKIVTLSILGPRELIGEMSFLEGQERSASAQTLTETKVFVITKETFEKILFSNPEITLELLKDLSKRLRKTDEKLEEIISTSLEEKILKVITTLSKFFLDGKITLSHEELADLIGATRARVTEVLDKLQQKGKIKLSFRQIQSVPQRTDLYKHL